MARPSRVTAPTHVEPETVELTIESLAAGGDGVARLDGLAVFVPRTALGDRVRVQLTRRRSFGRGRVVEMLEPAAERVEAPCPHYERDGCGGCQWQHLSLAAQRDAKAQLVVDAFRRIAHQDVARPHVTGDEHAFGYRRTISMTVRGVGRRRVGGFHAVGNPDTVVPIARCLLAHDDLQHAWNAVRRELARLPVSHGRDDASDLRVSLRRLGRVDDRSTGVRRADADGVETAVTQAAASRAEVALVVEGGSSWPAPELEAMAAAIPGCRGIWWQPADRSARLVWERGRGSTRDPDDALTVAASFAQVNASVAARLQAHVVSLVESLSPRVVVDAYAGAGALSALLAESGMHVTAIERDSRAAAFAAARLAAPSRVLAGSVEDRLPEVLPADAVIVNPPRGGVDARVCEQLDAAVRAGTAPQAVIYVSCDPATLARDVGRLSAWRVAAMDCFDMFPQTAHVETVCLLRPEAA